MQPKLIVVTGPSGIGKSFLANKLITDYPSLFTEAKVYTTRPPRSTEQQASDRIFLSGAEFSKMQAAGVFLVHAEFDNYQYGWAKDSLVDTSGKITITNVWPALATSFANNPQTILVALTGESTLLELLTQRMKNRGADEAQISQRIPLIRRDIHDIDRLTDNISSKGRVFTVQDDSTMNEIIIPWILSKTIDQV